MKVERVDGRHLEQATAEEFAALNNAASAVDSPHLEPISGEHLRRTLQFGWDNHGVPDVLTARTDAGELAAYAEIELPRWDNRQLAFIEMSVDPGHRDSTAADDLVDEAMALMKERERTTLMANAWAGTPLERLWLRRGLEIGSRAAQRRLLPRNLDWASLDRLHEASLEASAAYDIVEIPQPVPQEKLDDVLELMRTMNDAPLEDLVLEDHVWTAERWRDHEAAVAGRRIRSITLAAYERATGAVAGFSSVAVGVDRPHLGFQEDTAVVGAHRGHRLGIRLKIEMLKVLRGREPQLVQIDTWNAESNSHMIGVNEAIGCFVVGRGIELQRDLT